MYASLWSNGVPSLKKDVEYERNCIDEMPSSKYWLYKYDWDYDDNGNDNKTNQKILQ